MIPLDRERGQDSPCWPVWRSLGATRAHELDRERGQDSPCPCGKPRALSRVCPCGALSGPHGHTSSMVSAANTARAVVPVRDAGRGPSCCCCCWALLPPAQCRIAAAAGRESIALPHCIAAMGAAALHCSSALRLPAARRCVPPCSIEGGERERAAAAAAAAELGGEREQPRQRERERAALALRVPNCSIATVTARNQTVNPHEG